MDNCQIELGTMIYTSRAFVQINIWSNNLAMVLPGGIGGIFDVEVDYAGIRSREMAVYPVDYQGPIYIVNFVRNSTVSNFQVAVWPDAIS